MKAYNGILKKTHSKMFVSYSHMDWNSKHELSYLTYPLTKKYF